MMFSLIVRMRMLEHCRAAPGRNRGMPERDREAAEIGRRRLGLPPAELDGGGPLVGRGSMSDERAAV